MAVARGSLVLRQIGLGISRKTVIPSAIFSNRYVLNTARLKSTAYQSKVYPAGEDYEFSEFGRQQRQTGGFTFPSTKRVVKSVAENLVKNVYVEGKVTADRCDEDVLEFLQNYGISVEGLNLPKPILTVDETTFTDGLKAFLKKNGIETPFPIQSLTWPVAMSGRDTVGIAQTGSGKTLAFMLPAFLHILSNTAIKTGEGPRVLVVVPTRELALQVGEVALQYGAGARIRTALAYGGAERRRQISQIRKQPEIIICTPGRMLDFLESGVTNLKRCTYLVFDEADRMLDMGFEKDIRSIVDHIQPLNRQTLMWSATWPKEIRQLAKEFLTDPVHITVGSKDLTANSAIEQNIYMVEEYEKFSKLAGLLNQIAKDSTGSKTLIFVNQKRVADDVKQRLRQAGLPAMCMHGDYSQNQREEVFNVFRNRKKVVLIATDVVARGIDVQDIAHVINYDFPLCLETYIHRIGRTARANNTGKAHSFFSSANHGMARDLIRLLKESGQPVDPELKDIANHHQPLRKPSNYRRSNRSRSVLDFRNVNPLWSDD